MDIETINYKGKQFPIAISTAYINKFKTKVCKIFLIDSELFKTNQELAVNNLWGEYFKFILSNIEYFNTIF